MITTKQIKELLSKRYPRNFMIKKPLIGILSFFIFAFCFLVIYQPLQVHEARSFGLNVTMLFYCLVISISVFILLLILNKIRFFSENEEWTFFKELLFDVAILLGIGIAAYFAGFIIEAPHPRWNFSTFFDSLLRGWLLGILPVLSLTVLHIRCLFSNETALDFKSKNEYSDGETTEKLIRIISRSKKEELEFYPEQFVYAKSEGNYVVFYLFIEDKPCEVMIRNSISDIELQLSVIPYFMRTHRAFIVNLKRVISKSRNTPGYRLKLMGNNSIVPVSRQNTNKFDRMMK